MMTAGTVKEPPNAAPPETLGWRVAAWAGIVGVSRDFVEQLIKDGLIQSVKVRGRRIVTTAPKDFLKAGKDPSVSGQQ